MTEAKIADDNLMLEYEFIDTQVCHDNLGLEWAGGGPA